MHALYREILKADQVSDMDTFVSLGGESLSFVETSQRLERQVGALPTDWHLLSVAELEAGAGTGAGRVGYSGGWRRVSSCAPWR